MPAAGTTHGTLYEYDRRVPVILFGAGIEPGVRDEAATPADLAVTVASLVGVAAALARRQGADRRAEIAVTPERASMSAIRNGAALACLTAAIGLLWSRTPTAQTRGALATIVPAFVEQIEKVFYRAFTQMLPSNATFAVARAATIQAARDLDGSNSAAERAVTQAWTAVGVN